MPRPNSSALDFHEETKHSEFSVRMSAHYLDWDNRPHPFKIYRNLPSIPLPREFPHPRNPALQTLAFSPSGASAKSLDLGVLAEILFFSAGLTRIMKTRAGTYYMRAAPATGALYPIELYVVCREMRGIDPGVYHFNPFDFALVKLREGDYSPELADALGRPGLASPATIALTSLAWRNAWKYEARSYRHWFWDSGVITANLLATSSSAGVPVKVNLGFVDSQVDRLLGLAPEKEATVALVQLGPETRLKTGVRRREVSQLSLEVEPLSRQEIDYPLIWKTNRESSLHNPSEAEEWRHRFKLRTSENQPAEPSFHLEPWREQDPIPTLAEVILRRGSTRSFAPQPISFEHLSTVISASTSNVPLDSLPHGESLIDFYIIANDVKGLPSGSYFFDKGKNSLTQLKAGRFRDMSGYLCLGQPLFSDASAVFFLMTDLEHVLSSMGNRGYRAAQLEAGIRAGKIYLSAYSLGDGASGSTFFDDAVTEFFSPHAKDKSTMIAVGLGVPAYKARPGKVLVNNAEPSR